MTLQILKFSGQALLGAVSLLALAGASPSAAQVSQSEIDMLKAQIQALEKRLNEVQATQETKAAEAKAKPDAVELKFENGRPTLKSGDGNFEMALRGNMHFDMASYDQDDDNLSSVAPGRDLGDGANFRRAELGLEGKFMHDWEYHGTFTFGGSGVEGNSVGGSGGAIKNMYIGYTAIKPLKFQIGAMKPPMTLDDSTSANDITFIERASSAALAGSYGAGNGRTSVGVRGNTDNLFASAFYTRGVIGEGGVDEASNLVGRAVLLLDPNPDTDIHIGASGTKVMEFSQAAAAVPPALQGASATQFNLQDRPEMRVDGTRLASTGLLNVEDGFTAGPEFAARWKNFNLQGEYYTYQLDRNKANVAGATSLGDFNFDGWYIQSSWILTGEYKKYDIKNARFYSPAPSSPLGFGGIGAVELAARYSTVDLNDGGNPATCLGAIVGGVPAPAATSSCVRGGEQDIVTLGVNWYPNRNIRFMLNYLFIEIDRQAYPNNAAGAAGGPNAQIGQDYNVLALRTQYSF